MTWNLRFTQNPAKKIKRIQLNEWVKNKSLGHVLIAENDPVLQILDVYTT